MLTNQQITAMNTLTGYTHPPTTRQLADRLERPTTGTALWSYARTYATLWRLARRGLISRTPIGDGTRSGWALTYNGTRELADANRGVS